MEKRIFFEGIGCWFMSYEQNPNKRNTNNRVTVLIKKGQEISKGDKLIGNQHLPKGYSTYTITEVLEVRESKRTGFDYVTTLTEWDIVPLEKGITIKNLPKIK